MAKRSKASSSHKRRHTKRGSRKTAHTSRPKVHRRTHHGKKSSKSGKRKHRKHAKRSASHHGSLPSDPKKIFSWLKKQSGC